MYRPGEGGGSGSRTARSRNTAGPRSGCVWRTGERCSICSCWENLPRSTFHRSPLVLRSLVLLLVPRKSDRGAASPSSSDPASRCFVCRGWRLDEEIYILPFKLFSIRLDVLSPLLLQLSEQQCPSYRCFFVDFIIVYVIMCTRGRENVVSSS